MSSADHDAKSNSLRHWPEAPTFALKALKQLLQLISVIIVIFMKNVRTTDLNLLVVFDAMMSERNVTKAGERMGLAQPSMSNALARLRTLFDDELFVRTPDGMVPTPLAIDASEHVRTAIRAAEEALSLGGDFEPETAEGRVVILTHDLIEMTLIPDLVRALEVNAPGISLHTRPLLRKDFFQELDTGIADLAIGAASNLPERFHYSALFSEPFSCIARRDHPTLSGELTLEKFLACKHALFSPKG
ncbi:MAG: LysR family transcriptional regulator, partial [Pseudomonadota bacterium]